MIKEKIINLIKNVVSEGIDFDLSVSGDERNGHYATNVSFKLVKINHQAPMAIAKELVENLNKIAPVGFFEKIEIAEPGFINFWLTNKVLQDELKEILKKKNNYGRLKAMSSKLKAIQIEYISANPTGPLTLANGRGGFFGDVLANILEFQGFKVEREYYVNDTGNQIITLGKSILASAGFFKEEENFYKGGYIKDWEKKNSLKIKKYQDNYLKVGQMAAKDFLNDIKKVIKKSGIKFDRFTSEEKDIHKKSFINKILHIFEEKDLCYKSEGALWLKTTKFGDDKDRVLITSDGFPTYFLADSGHYLETKKRGFTNKINILGPDHYGYVKRIQAAAKIVGLKKSDMLITQSVRLVSGGQELKMSKRKGDFITFDDLISEVGHDVARFFFLMYSLNTHMDFDFDLAKEKSPKNPVYYIQYASVRILSILTKIKNHKSQITNKNSKINFELLNTPEDLNLMKMLARFPEVVESAAVNYNPSILARYALDLAKEFHNFYEKERVAGEEENLILARMALIQAVYTVFQNLFKLLGISLPKKM